VVVPEGAGPLTLPAIRLEPTAYTQMLGQPAPQIDAVDLDSGRPVHLADFRGKVVLLDFWGYWCGPCVTRMSKLAELQGKYREHGLIVLSIHDASARSRADYDRLIAPTRNRLWGGHDLPLRVLLDRPDPKKEEDRSDTGTGATIRTYNVTLFPTYFLIDARGQFVGLVPSDDPKVLEENIRRLLDGVKSGS
jgi:thiol-disulfide isomerase/thioredoxin